MSSRRQGTETTQVSLKIADKIIEQLKEEMDRRAANSIQEVVRAIIGEYFSKQQKEEEQ